MPPIPPLTRVTVRHETTYRYHQPVSLRPHRLLLRPRESRDLRLISSDLRITPDATVSWSQDVAGNTVATVYFKAPASLLRIESSLVLELAAHPWPVFDVAASAITFPFRYSDNDWIDLGALTVRQYPDPRDRLRQWAQGFVRSNPTDTLALLKDISAGVHGWIRYQSRDDEGTQTPVETLDRGWGTCRDLAVLFIEAVRSLGFGARIVSGYFRNADRIIVPAGDTTHAWAEVYVPGAGWVTFDPTNLGIGGFNLIPTAVGRGIDNVMPVTGSFFGMNTAFANMTVDVVVLSGPARTS